MKSFEYAAPKTLKEAAELLGAKWGETEILAGGTDLITSLKQNITEPKRVVSLRNIEELKGVEIEQKGVRIGAMTTLAELAANKNIKEHFPSPRCWYFRNGFGLFAQHEGVSLAREGENRYHAIFANEGPALFVSPSSFGPAFIALGATLTVAGPKGKTRKIPAEKFFQAPKSDKERETTLKPNEILTDIFVPTNGLRNATYEVRHRQGLDWPYVTATVAFQLKTGMASDSRVILGHVAPVPWHSPGAGKALNGVKVDGASAAKCGEAATQGAKPLGKNGYKVQLVKAAVKRAVLAAAEV